MPLGNPIPGSNWAAEYAVSAVPWVSSSSGSGLMEFDFPFVTRFFVVKNTSPTLGSTINVGFTANGVSGQNQNNYFQLAPAESFEGELRVTRVFVSGSGAYSLSLIAGLTTIPAGNMLLLTGSNGVSGVG